MESWKVGDAQPTPAVITPIQNPFPSIRSPLTTDQVSREFKRVKDKKGCGSRWHRLQAPQTQLFTRAGWCLYLQTRGKKHLVRRRWQRPQPPHAGGTDTAPEEDLCCQSTGDDSVWYLCIKTSLSPCSFFQVTQLLRLIYYWVLLALISLTISLLWD